MVASIVEGSPGRDFLDVGVGTGIAARQFKVAGCRVLGLDVDARMADVARRHGITVEVAPFESWDPAGRVFDAVISGQSWHWIDPVAGAAKATEVLRPGGRFAAFWNVARASPVLANAFAETYRRVLEDVAAYNWAMPSPESYVEVFSKAAAGLQATGAFGPAERWEFEWERIYTRDEWLDQLPTHGGHGQLPPATLKKLLTGIGAVIDASGGSLPLRYTTVAITALRAQPV